MEKKLALLLRSIIEDYNNYEKRNVAALEAFNIANSIGYETGIRIGYEDWPVLFIDLTVKEKKVNEISFHIPKSYITFSYLPSSRKWDGYCVEE